MVYITSWQEYQEAAENLYVKSPGKTRYCVKWKSSEGKLVLKITDDTTCIKFKTYSSIFLNRFESLNLSLMQKMQNRRPDPPPSTATPQSFAVGDSSHPRAASPVPVTQTGTAAGGVKKKKPKKKK
ncbi:signal recognition particle, SRP9/SRP14 subunit [Boletus edulis]|uniref:Signal recognition particle, SRP9/SRP14 subunit n=1 Tax=Boletus edulis BED1 TaxID=1328754 RepID=A0AAD4BUT1_BOLED|nr:signal recognition particle, SRP9/SRP14 subunit [Boletus edulis]KAF8439947.1 signal recognition particle, SRP9/SRP14 subunit [Boletus edulis BED1]